MRTHVPGHIKIPLPSVQNPAPLKYWLREAIEQARLSCVARLTAAVDAQAWGDAVDAGRELEVIDRELIIRGLMTKI